MSLDPTSLPPDTCPPACSYVVSLDLEDLRRDTDNCLSKVKANFVGTEYVLWTRGEDRDMKKVREGGQGVCVYKGESYRA
jgi:hypothetical protein